MRLFLPVLLIFILLLPSNAWAINLIRDAEIERTLHEYGAPVFKAAGIPPENMRIYIVNDPTINAFTIGGFNLFINTGLILRCDNSNMIIGVMAHETGHIAGGHIIKRMGEIEDLSVESIVSLLLGVGATVAGLPQAGMGVMMAGQNVAERNYMSYSRQQEVAADAAAIKFLNATHQSGAGMLKLFQILRRDETLSYGTLDPYAISHPLSEERIEHIRSEVFDAQMPDVDKYADQQARMVAKLHGFLEKPDITLLTYTDNSIPSLYARSIAYFEQSNFPKAFGEIDKLLALKPNDPFFNELKGQFLSESGHPKEALPYYEKANKLYPNSSLIKTELGKLLLNSNRTDEAILEFSQSAALEKTDTETWHLLAAAYGKKNDEGMSSLALAEEANTSGKNSEARKFARRAKDKLPKNSPAWLRANDILADVKLRNKDDNDSDDDKSNS